MYKIMGNFINGDRYTDTAKNKNEFNWVIDSIRKNGACMDPDTITGTKEPDKLPGYIKEYLESNYDVKYINESHEKKYINPDTGETWTEEEAKEAAAQFFYEAGHKSPEEYFDYMVENHMIEEVEA